MIFLDDKPIPESIWTWNHFGFGLTYAIVASFIFIFILLFLFKPKIRIAPFLITVIKNDVTNYVFKFVNVSYFSAHDIHAELHKTRRIPMGEGKFNNEYKKLTLVNGEISHIPARLPFMKKKDGDPHCLTISSIEDINEILSVDSNGIVLRISLKHSLTGLSKVFEAEYAKQSIKQGKFKPGTKFAIL